MTDAGAPWLATMRELVGVKEYVGGDNNPIIIGWTSFIAQRYPEMANYAAGYKHDSIPWCGLTMAYALAKNGIKPPFGDTDVQRFLWANSFANDRAFVATDPRPGSIAVFKWANGGGHVGVVDRADANMIWVAGGNQSDGVNVAPFRRDNQVVGFFWPEKVAAAAAPVRTPDDVRRRMGKAITLAEARRDAQGRLAVYALPAGDGGGAYEVAGINERYHPVAAAKLKGLIEAGQHQEAEDFVGDYTASYTDVADVWTISWGIEFYLRDCVFNRGPTGGALIIQIALKSLGEDLGQTGKLRDGVDGEVGPLTADALRRQEADVSRFLQSLRAAREHYERVGNQYINGGPHRDESSQFWRGLINRFNNALTVARRFHAEQPRESTVTDPQTPPGPQSSPGTIPDLTSVGIDPKKMQDVLQAAMIAMMVIQMMQGKQVQIPGNLLPGPSTQPEPPPVVQAAPPAPTPADPTNTGTNLWAKILGLLGAGGAAVAASTGVIEPATALTTGIASFIPLVGGVIGIWNPTVGRMIGGLGGLLHRATAPAQNPPTK